MKLRGGSCGGNAPCVRGPLFRVSVVRCPVIRVPFSRGPCVWFSRGWSVPLLSVPLRPPVFHTETLESFPGMGLRRRIAPSQFFRPSYLCSVFIYPEGPPCCRGAATSVDAPGWGGLLCPLEGSSVSRGGLSTPHAATRQPSLFGYAGRQLMALAWPTYYPGFSYMHIIAHPLHTPMQHLTGGWPSSGWLALCGAGWSGWP